MSIEQQNELIAVFDGFRRGKAYYRDREDGQYDCWYDDAGRHADSRTSYISQGLKYNSSWSWLMPVGEKIFNWLQAEAKKRPRHTCTEGDLIEVDITCALREYDKAGAHEHIVRWIEWFNQQPTSPI